MISYSILTGIQESGQLLFSDSIGMDEWLIDTGRLAYY